MSSALKFIVELLNPAKHRREAFDCGVEALNEFLQMRARKEMESNLSACFVMIPETEPGRIAGFFTLSAATIIRSELPEVLVKKLPRYSRFPATLLGRLARSLDFKGQHIGERLMVSAFVHAVECAKQVASWAVITDPKDENALRFYKSFGFQTLTPDRLFLPMKDAIAFLSAR